ncbi:MULTISPECIES: hypothetical protein [Fischerella]|jgi:hypothetical protein|nr:MULTISPECIES: hypothetical protein [Fischerella]
MLRFEKLQNIIDEAVISEDAFLKFCKSACFDNDGFDLLIEF